MSDLAVRVDRRVAEPVYEQISRQIREHIAKGDLAPGAALPSVRTMASDLGVNLNTVARAYRLLEEQGFVRIRGRTGVQVRPPAVTAPAEARTRMMGELEGLLSRMHQVGFPAVEVRGLVDRVLAGLGRREMPSSG